MSDRILMVCLAAALCCFANVACRDNNNAGGSVAADNTARNKVDRDADTKTSFDQSESSPDIKITAAIRREIMKADDMSTTAQNCKVITEKGTVTLRGPVNNLSEKDRIATLASNVAGVVRVDNQLEIKTP